MRGSVHSHMVKLLTRLCPKVTKATCHLQIDLYIIFCLFNVFKNKYCCFMGCDVGALTYLVDEIHAKLVVTVVNYILVINEKLTSVINKLSSLLCMAVWQLSTYIFSHSDYMECDLIIQSLFPHTLHWQRKQNKVTLALTFSIRVLDTLISNPKSEIWFVTSGWTFISQFMHLSLLTVAVSCLWQIQHDSLSLWIHPCNGPATTDSVSYPSVHLYQSNPHCSTESH